MTSLFNRAAVAAATILVAHSVTAQAPSPKPRLVVHIGVDQLRPDYLTTWESQFTGGYKRLLNEGAFFANGYQDHANTETAPGHASMLSGRFPYSTGIIANSLGVETNDVPLVDFPGQGASPFRFRGTTLANWMQRADPRTRVFSVSRKDRSAILPVASNSRHTVMWYAPQVGRFTTSVYYADTLPTFVKQFNAERGVFKLAGKAWNLLLPESAYPEADSVATEGRSDITFPHVLPTDSMRATAMIQNFPWIDSLTLALALRGVSAMELGGRADRTDLLAVSLSATDGIGHRYGPDSRELHDQVLRVDRYLGAFIDSLYKLRGRENVIISFTADHGATPPVGITSRWGDNSRAISIPSATFRPLVADARAALRTAGVDTMAIRYEDLVLWYDRTKPGAHAFDPTPVVNQFMTAVQRVPGVMRVDRIADLSQADTTRDAIARRIVRMFVPGQESFPGQMAMAAVTLTPFNRVGTGDPGQHGSPHDADARVPVAFLGGPFVARRFDTKVNTVDIAPTLADVLGITPTERVDGRVVREARR
jgi:predicted AlkP superfamily pyrophosphatase or phosphodiesterase